MHVLVAPNAFKNSLSAVDAAAAIADGLRASRFGGTWTLCPVGDGGDGTADLLRRHAGGSLVPIDVLDPLGRPIEAHFSLIDSGRTAIIELAAASGLRCLETAELDPLRATSFGTGELILAALDRGVREIILCVGGSASVDGGTGILEALGAAFLDAAGRALGPLPESLLDLSGIDRTTLDARLRGCALTVVCDVSNPLLGERGAATVFGPQKGATPPAVRHLEAALQRFAAVVQVCTGRDIARVEHGGAAGGVAAGLYGLLDARLVNGIDYFLHRMGFDDALDAADLVITGEGSIDEQTPDGKGPWGVAMRARARGVFVVGIAGQVPLLPSAMLRTGFDVLLPIANGALSLPDAMSATAANLRRTAYELGTVLALRASDQPQVRCSATIAPTK